MRSTLVRLAARLGSMHMGPDIGNGGGGLQGSHRHCKQVRGLYNHQDAFFPRTSHYYGYPTFQAQVADPLEGYQYS